MKIVSISQDFFDLVEGDRELMLKHNRPCIVGRPRGAFPCRFTYFHLRFRHALPVFQVKDARMHGGRAGRYSWDTTLQMW